MYSYLKRRKQNVKTNNTENLLTILVFKVPPGYILGSILFNLFINDVFFIKKANFVDFAEDNTTYAASKDNTSLLEILKSELKVAIKFAYPDKFQAIAVHHNKNIDKNYVLITNNIKVKSKYYIKFLCIEPDDNLLCDKNIVSLSEKAVNQLHALCRLKNQMGKNEKEIFINSFAYSKFNYCPLAWDFC